MKKLIIASHLLILFLTGCKDGDVGSISEEVQINKVVEEIKQENLELTEVKELYIEGDSDQATFKVDTSKDVIAVYVFKNKKQQEESTIYNKLSTKYGSSLLAYSKGNFTIFLIKKDLNQFDIEYKITKVIGRL
jgi:PBP1b-binding outer membrane lipoprotein LpoB